jgi:hypothetical protein
MQLVVQSLVSVVTDREERALASESWNVQDQSGRATACRPPIARECGITDGQEWIDLCG